MTISMMSPSRIAIVVVFALVVCLGSAFTTPVSPSLGAQSASSRFMGSTMKFVPRSSRTTTTTRTTTKSQLNMFLGSDGGILGVGTPEVFTILLVGYFVLGPSDLYKLVKEIGKFIQNFRTLGTEATKSFESTMESQLELEDLRKASRELNDAFSFRRSINVDQDEPEAFAEPERGAEPIKAVATAAAGTAETGKPKKRIRRRKKKVVVEEEEAPPAPFDENSGAIPDLDMTSSFDEVSASQEAAMLMADKERVKAERLERLEAATAEATESTPPADWFGDDPAAAATPEATEPSPQETNRFASQLTDDWNEQVMANTDKLSPLAQVMERLALLEEEKNTADARLEEEFMLRAELEEKYYREKRTILEEAAMEVQAAAYITPDAAVENSSASTETV